MKEVSIRSPYHYLFCILLVCLVCNNLNFDPKFFILDELVDLSTFNLFETIQNKWLQQYGKKECGMYVVTCDHDLVQAFMQSTNYKG
jgi:hypothetical protein